MSYLMIDFIVEGWECSDELDAYNKNIRGGEDAIGDIMDCSLREELPKYKRFCYREGDIEVYYDYGADYYFFVVVGDLEEELLDSGSYYEQTQ